MRLAPQAEYSEGPRDRSLPMIRMPREDGRCAVELLQQHDPHQPVRPRRCAKGKAQLGPSPQTWCQSIGTSDQENCFRNSVIAPSPDSCSEIRARQCLAAHIERDNCGNFWNGL